jgi:hypothetical protein
MLAKKKAPAKGKKKATVKPVSRGFGAKAPSAAEDALIKQATKLAKAVGKEGADIDGRPWMQLAAAAADAEEYAEARMVLEAGAHHCRANEEHANALVGALGQMRRVGPEPAVELSGRTVDWPGKDDESPYDGSGHTFKTFSSPVWPDDCPRGTMYPTGDSTVRLSTTPILDPDECAWVVAAANAHSDAAWVGDHADKANIGTDKIWAKPFPDRLWLREVPGLTEWFEHRLRTRLFPMLQSLYPEAIPTVDCLRCHDAFISRYDAEGMASLEVHQDTTDFTFTISLNPLAKYEGGGTVFPSLRDAADTAGSFETMVVKPDVGCVASFPGRLRHGGNAITSGFRYIIPLFIYLDVNKLSGKPRGYLLDAAGLGYGPLSGLDAVTTPGAAEQNDAAAALAA